jgi:membrane protease subunit HflC
MQGKSLFVAIGLILVLLLASSTLYVVKETERAVMLRFGEVVKADIPPGLHFKLPSPINSIRKFEGRLLTLDAKPERFLTVEKKSLIIDSYAKWKIENVGQYYTATNGEESRTQALLSQLINDGLRNEVGERDMHEVVSGKRDELMAALTEKINAQALQDYGIKVVDIRVKQVDLPNDVRHSVYDRMNTERQKEAREHRSRGQEMAEGIRASADREKVVIEANAYRQAEELRGEGEAKASEIYTKSYNRNPEFYAFWRTLNAYENTFSSKSDVILLKPDNDFLRYMNTSKPK